MIGPGDRVLVTGASGFVGSALTRALLARGVEVAALIQPGARTGNLAGLELERHVGDVRDAAVLARASAGARVVFHLAALYRFWPEDASEFYAVNVEGTRAVLAAAGAAGCERVVYTSTVATLGHDGPRPATEESFPRLERLRGAYERSKYVAEHEALRAAARGLPVVLALPSAPFGPGDETPTPTGRLVVDFLNGRVSGWIDTVMNVVDVDDVAAGQILAAEQGAVGESYILGGENLALRDLLGLLAACTGLPAPRRKLPRAALLPLGYVAGALEGRVARRDPTVTATSARVALSRRPVDDGRARRELGYRSRPAAEALERAARWFFAHGYVRPERIEAFHWSSERP